MLIAMKTTDRGQQLLPLTKITEKEVCQALRKNIYAYFVFFLHFSIRPDKVRHLHAVIWKLTRQPVTAQLSVRS